LPSQVSTKDKQLLLLNLKDLSIMDRAMDLPAIAMDVSCRLPARIGHLSESYIRSRMDMSPDCPNSSASAVLFGGRLSSPAYKNLAYAQVRCTHRRCPPGPGALFFFATQATSTVTRGFPCYCALSEDPFTFFHCSWTGLPQGFPRTTRIIGEAPSLQEVRYATRHLCA
jgi:hypothetical protein